jgi:tetratricopeptide (TPR) repeat protein
MIDTYPEKPKRGHKAKRSTRSSSGGSIRLLALMLLVTLGGLALYFQLDRATPDRALYAQRVADYTAQIADDPNDIDAYIDRGFAYRSLGNYDQAIADFDQAIVIEGAGRNFRPLVGLGMVQESLKHYDAALAYHQQALQVQLDLGHSTADPYYRLGNLYNLMGDDAQAMVSYRRSIEADPTYPNGYMGLANELYAAKDYAAALENYERYLDIQGADSYTYILDRVVELRRDLGVHED